MNGGFVKIYRGILDHPVCHKDNDYLAVWLFLLSNANYSPAKAEFNNRVITVNPGQIITGRKKISAICMVDEHKVDRILNRLKSEQMIEQQTSNKNRLITVLNWSLYQNGEQQNEQQVSNEWATSEQQVSTIEERKKNKNTKNKDKDEHTTPAKSSFGEFGKVKLTADEHAKIVASGLTDYIARVDAYKASTGKRYSSDYATILNWARKDGRTEKKTFKTRGVMLE